MEISIEQLERLGDRELEYVLDRLEWRVRSAIATGDPRVISALLGSYLEAQEESRQRFETWLEERSEGQPTGESRVSPSAIAS